MTKTSKKFDGMVPIGGVVFIGNVQFFSAPVNNEVKNGWALCNGQRIDSLGPGNYDPILLTASINQTVPYLNNLRFLMGSTILSVGTVGGENTNTLSHYHSGTTNSTASASFTGIAGTLTVNVPRHGHQTTATISAGGHAHEVTWSARYGEGTSGGGSTSLGSTGATAQSFPSFFGGSLGTSTSSGYHYHTAALPTTTDGAFTASGSNTPSGNINIGSVTQRSFNTLNGLAGGADNRPPFITGVFIMRVL